MADTPATWVITTLITSLRQLITLSAQEVTPWLITTPFNTVFPTLHSNTMEAAEATAAEAERERHSLTPLP